MSLIEHAKKELSLAGLFDKDAYYDGMLGDDVMELVEVFSKQGHSGFSAGMALDIFNKVCRYDTLSPLTGNDEEWNEVGGDLYQNTRNSGVFKEGKDGRPYFIRAYTKRTPNGNCWHGCLELKDGRHLGRCFIKDFANMPTITIDVLEEEVSLDEWNMWLEDESQLEKLAKYYDFEIV